MTTAGMANNSAIVLAGIWPSPSYSAHTYNLYIDDGSSMRALGRIFLHKDSSLNQILHGDCIINI
jgi:hypothetical protein